MMKNKTSLVALAITTALFSYGATAADHVNKQAYEKNGHFLIKDGDFKLKTEVRAQFDAAFFDSKEDISMSNGVEVRRARLGLKADLGKDWKAEIDINFADSPDSEVKDLWLKYVGMQNHEFTLGQKKVNFSVGEVTSSRAINFINRPVAVDLYAPGHRVTLDHVYYTDKFRVNWGFFGDTLSTWNEDEDDVLKDNGTDTSFNYFGRVNYMPYQTMDSWMIIGASFAAIEPEPVDRTSIDGEQAEDYYKVDSEAGWGVDGNEPLELRSQGIERAYHYGIELLGNYKNFGFQAEYLGSTWTHTDGTFTDEDDEIRSYSDLDDIETNGGYATFMWYPQGLHRGADMWDAEREYVRVGDGPGIWELLARVETVDLSDGAGKTGAERARGGEYTGFTLGANYYFTDNMKFMLNLHYADLKDAASDNWKNKDNRYVVDGQAVEGGTDDEVYAVMARMQFQF